MYISIQTVCACHGFLLFESIHCDRCRSLIPFQISEESLIDPIAANNLINGMNMKSMHGSKHAANTLVPYQKHHHHHHRHEQPAVTTGRVRFRALCPFCNSPNYVLRYYCKRERVYHHLRIQNFNENDQSVYKSIADTQNMDNVEKKGSAKHGSMDSSGIESVDSISLTGSTSQYPPSTILYDQSGVPNARDIQIQSEKNLYALNSLEGDLFNVLRNGLFYDTIIQCQDEVKLQVHRCILGGRSPWFRHLLGEYHDSNTQDEYVLQISIDDVQSDVMNEILNYLYTNRCLISLKNAPDLLIAAKRFELHKLRKQIAEFLLLRLNVDNAIDMLISAHEAGSDALKSACIRVINRNAEKLKRTEKWKTFKIQYIDLIPELYENRVERPPHGAEAYVPDVFSGPVIPSESLITLSQLYENPVKQRATSPSPRILIPPIKSQPMQHIQANETTTQGISIPFVRDNRPTISPVAGREDSIKKRTATNNTRRRPAPQQAPPLTRTVFPTVKRPTEDDPYRRPVNIYDKSVALPTNNHKQQTVSNQIPQKPPPPAPTKLAKAVSPKHVVERQRSPPPTKPSRAASPKHVVERQRSPPPTKLSRAVSPKHVVERHRSPPPTKTTRAVSPKYVSEHQRSPPPTKISRAVSPKYVIDRQRSPSMKISRTVSPKYVVERQRSLSIKMSRTMSPENVMELHRSPTLTDTPQEEHITLERIVSAETTD